MKIEERVKEILSEDAAMREVEPHIYSNYPKEEAAYYDEFGGLYETVACNRFYNRLVWGYWISEYKALCADVLNSAHDEWVLDAGCGSLTFTAETYLQNMTRPTVLLDQSIRMIRLAKTRLIKLNGCVPDNMLFIQGDITSLPFKDASIGSVMAMNVLHAVKDGAGMLRELRRVMRPSGSLSFTTLVKTNRLADRYLDKLGAIGAMVPRSLGQILEIADEAGTGGRHLTKGNLALAHHGRAIDYFAG